MAGSFVCRCLTSPTMLRLHTPLIEPDVRFSRFRLSDKVSRFRPRAVAGQRREAGEAVGLIQCLVRVTGPSAPEASAALSPPQRFRLLLAGATVARRVLLPLKTGAFPRHTEK